MIGAAGLDPDICRTAIAAAAQNGNACGYRHPLGFSHIAIPWAGPYKLRLHVWSPDGADDAPPMPQIHNHAFRFVSLVLRGSVRHTPFCVAPAASAMSGALAIRQVEQRGDETWLVPTGAWAIASREPAQLIGRGQLYASLENTYHLSESVGVVPAMTMVAAQPVATATSYVLSASNASDSLTWHKQWLAAACVSGFLEEAMAWLAALPVRPEALQ